MAILTYTALTIFFVILFSYYYYKKRKLPDSNEAINIAFYGSAILGSISSILNITQLVPSVFPEIEENKNVVFLIMSFVVIILSARELNRVLKPKSILKKRR
jgi:uncharacterized membrane protein YfcA